MSDLIPGRNGTKEQWFEYCAGHPSSALCDDIPSYYDYKISFGANVAFLSIFSVSLALFLATYALTRRGVAFTVALSMGVVLEILGYAGRVWSANNQWAENPFLMQICCLTIAPAFMAAGIYLCLRRIVCAFGPENSRIPPEYYTRIFIPCDLVSLILQAVGGAMASFASHKGTSTDTGDNVMIAGLAFQVLTLFVFMLVTADFALNLLRRHRALGAAALDQNPVLVRVRRSPAFRGFLAALTVATLCIFVRSVFRVAELSKGWTGPIMSQQKLFIGFEGSIISLAALALNLFHPSFCFAELMEGAGGFGQKRAVEAEADEAASAEKHQSDTERS